MQNKKKMFMLYTDGSCLNNNDSNKEMRFGGYAYIIKGEKEYIENVGSVVGTTNNRMELTALIKGFEAINKMELLKGSSIMVVTDSEFIVNSFNKKWLDNWVRNSWMSSRKQPVLNKDLWINLRREIGTRTVEWQWVRGHNGIPDNERCDFLSKQAATDLMRSSFKPVIEEEAVDGIDLWRNYYAMIYPNQNAELKEDVTICSIH